MIHELGLEDFYVLSERPGAPVKGDQNDYRWMDEPVLRDRLLQFRHGSRSVVRFRLPSIHCSSCIWLLERLPEYQSGVYEARVHFGRRELELHFDPERASLSHIALQLQRLGYAPDINRADMDASPLRNNSRDPLLMRLGVAGFCAGNIMLLSFPDYLNWDPITAGPMFALVEVLKVLLSLPVLFYSGSIYWKSAWLALRKRLPSVDIPIALGMLALSIRSYYDIAVGEGPGYLDSLAGLVFLLLIGRWFQDRIYGYLTFQRDYRSFFPASVLKVLGRERKPVLPDELQPGDTMFIRPGEVIPADGQLLQKARIDYHFITGESEPELLAAGSGVYGGGRVLDSPVEILVQKSLGASYLISLWDRDALRSHDRMTRMTDQFARWFTPLVLLIATVATVLWWPAGPARALEILTAVLIVACPCGLALAAPFTLGHALRFLDRSGLHLRDTGALERMAVLDTLVFDKTGTITAPGKGELHWQGEVLSQQDMKAVAALAACSAHPLSVRLAAEWGSVGTGQSADLRVDSVQEHSGQGLEGLVGGVRMLLGSAEFVLAPEGVEKGGVHLRLNDRYAGRVVIEPALRPGAETALQALAHSKDAYTLELLSGDKSRDEEPMLRLFPQSASLRFGVSPHDKLERIEQLQQQGHRVGMFGDGLNDAGALAAADVGLAFADDLSGYFPAADGVIIASSLSLLPRCLSYARAVRKAVWTAIGMSVLYNLVGLSFAIAGLLTPLVAAILMPLSSVSVAGLGLALASWRAWQLGLSGSAPRDPEERESDSFHARAEPQGPSPDLEAAIKDG